MNSQMDYSDDTVHMNDASKFTLQKFLNGEERPSNIISLLTILVTLLHIYAPPSDTPPPPPPAASAASSESNPAPAFVEANFKANYLSNPKPEYPAIAKSRGWQGKVMLRVQVSAEGTALHVSVETSSGHEMLDESATEAVNKWKFIPAKRGDTAVVSTVIVPIIFTLRE